MRVFEFEIGLKTRISTGGFAGFSPRKQKWEVMASQQETTHESPKYAKMTPKVPQTTYLCKVS